MEEFRRRSEGESGRFVEAAHALLEEAGAPDFTVRQVVQRAGLSLRSFYQYFGGKDELLVALYEECIRDAMQRFALDLERHSGPLVRLRALVIGFFERSLSPEGAAVSRALAREHLRLSHTHPAELRHAMEPQVELFAGEIGAAMRAGAVRAEDPRLLAVLVSELVSSSIHAALLGTGGAEITGEKVWDFCRRALVARSPE